ncbi:zinc finger BED domain-containing protein 1-like, partial [Rhagoletis pomonella]|uniref:zinc finger BED domain-containing protein 1-like n=1 Tax=Rhagoletis pomonella TaxID=28610 RepID=UPI00177AFCD9
MPNKKSEIWLHFSDEKDKKVKCKLCGQQISVANKSTTSLIRHMNRRHPFQKIARQEHLETEVDTQAAATQVEAPQRAATQVESQQAATQRNTPRASYAPQGSVSQYLHKPLPVKKQQQIDDQVIKMIVREYHPFSIVEDVEFKKLVCLLNSNYKLPTRKTVSSSLIPAMYNVTMEVVKRRLERAYAICVTMDGWTSRAGDSFFSVTAHYIVEEDKKTFLASDLLACSSYLDRHTSENITKKINEIFCEWGVSNKICVIVSDNAANMKAAVRGG